MASQWLDGRLLNVIHLGVAMLLLFSAFNSSRFIQEIVVDSYAYSNESGGNIDPHAGYYAPSIKNVVMVLTVLFVPSIVAVLGAKWTMVVGALCYVFLVASFLLLAEWLLYVASAVQGFGAAVLWTAQGKYLTQISDSDTMTRNSGIIWGLYRGGLCVGGAMLYAVFSGGGSKRLISLSTIRLIYSMFVASTLAGTVLFALLREPKRTTKPNVAIVPSVSANVKNGEAGISSGQKDDLDHKIKETNYNALKRGLAEHLVGTVRLVFTKHMLLMSVVFCYTGFEGSFWIGIYPTCLGFTDRFPTKGHTLLAYHAWGISLGEIVAGATFGLMGHRFNRFGRNVVVFAAYTLHTVAFYLVFINLPSESPLHHTDDTAYIRPPNVPVAVFCSFVFGLCNALWATQIYSVLGTLYAEHSTQAFAIYRWFQAVTGGVALFYSSLLALHWHLLILSLWAAAAALCFFPVEFHAQRVAARKKKGALQ